MMTFVSMLMTAFNVYELLIIIRVFMSWINPNPYNPIVSFIADLTDPFLGAIERFMPQVLLSPLNFSPIVAILLLGLIKQAVFNLLI